MLHASGIMHLDPSWINKLVRCLTDHRLADAGRKDWWRIEMEDFIDAGRSEGSPSLLFQAHEDFRRTGRLTRDYLKFLWREVDEVKTDHDVLDSLIETISYHGVMLNSPSLSPTGDRQLLVPFRLPPEVDPSALTRLEDATRHGRRMRFTWSIGKHAPSDMVGLVLTQCLSDKRIQVRACWRSGIAFAMDDLEHLVCLHTTAADKEKGRMVSLELSVAARGDSMPLQDPAMVLKDRLESMMRGCFPGVICVLSENGEVTRGDHAWEACLQQMRHHLDFQLGHFGAAIDAVMATTRSTLAKMTAMHDTSFPYPALVVMRPETEADRQGRVRVGRDAWCSKRALRDVAFLIRGCYSKPMRLFFICPYDFTEVPCGVDGAGYPFRMGNEWCRKLYPAVQVRQRGPAAATAVDSRPREGRLVLEWHLQIPLFPFLVAFPCVHLRTVFNQSSSVIILRNASIRGSSGTRADARRCCKDSERVDHDISCM